MHAEDAGTAGVGVWECVGGSGGERGATAGCVLWSAGVVVWSVMSLNEVKLNNSKKRLQTINRVPPIWGAAVSAPITMLGRDE